VLSLAGTVCVPAAYLFHRIFERPAFTFRGGDAPWRRGLCSERHRVRSGQRS
jgi:hypothetical protein